MKNFLLFASILSSVNSVNLKAQTASDEYDLQIFTRNFMAAYNQQDPAALQKMYTEFATRIDTADKEFTGADQIGTYFTEQFKNNNTTLLLRPSSVFWSDAEHAFVAKGTYEIYGKTNVYDINIHTTGAYANTMVKYNGKWKIARSVLSPIVKILIHHQVEDFTQWKSGFEQGLPMRLAAGEISSEFGTLHNDPKTVYIISEWISLEAFQTFFANPELEKAMRQAGVTGKPTILILDRK